MRVVNTTKNYHNPRFDGWYRNVTKAVNGKVKVIHRNNTSVYRDEAWWQYFGQFIDKFFKDSDRVNTYNWGCSNGAEAFTFIMHMFSNFSETAEKFMPIQAKDYDPVAIKAAKTYTLPLDVWELYNMRKFTGGQYAQFITNPPYCIKDFISHGADYLMRIYEQTTKNTSGLFYARINQQYKKYIDYETSDVLIDYKKIKSKESLVMLRNFLPYLGEEKVFNLLKNLSKQMKEKSVLVVGNYDLIEIQSLRAKIESLGFEASSVNGVFYKS